MLHYALIFLLIGLVAGALGFGELAAGASSMAKVLAIIFLVLAAVTLLRRR